MVVGPPQWFLARASPMVGGRFVRADIGGSRAPLEMNRDNVKSAGDDLNLPAWFLARASKSWQGCADGSGCGKERFPVPSLPFTYSDRKGATRKQSSENRRQVTCAWLVVRSPRKVQDHSLPPFIPPRRGKAGCRREPGDEIRTADGRGFAGHTCRTWKAEAHSADDAAPPLSKVISGWVASGPAVLTPSSRRKR